MGSRWNERNKDQKRKLEGSPLDHPNPQLLTISRIDVLALLSNTGGGVLRRIPRHMRGRHIRQAGQPGQLHTEKDGQEEDKINMDWRTAHNVSDQFGR
jgi:hypothetical protein